MRGINHVVVSGNIGDRIVFRETGSGTAACSFSVASDRHTADGSVTAWVKVNVYGAGLVNLCRQRLGKGGYAIIEGELMNRDGQLGELTEVRAKEIVFINDGRQAEEEGEQHGS